MLAQLSLHANQIYSSFTFRVGRHDVGDPRRPRVGAGWRCHDPLTDKVFVCETQRAKSRHKRKQGGEGHSRSGERRGREKYTGSQEHSPGWKVGRAHGNTVLEIDLMIVSHSVELASCQCGRNRIFLEAVPPGPVMILVGRRELEISIIDAGN